MSWEPMASMMPIVICLGIFAVVTEISRIQGTN
jgi:hypothetical protein